MVDESIGLNRSRPDEPVPSPCISICTMDATAGTADERVAGGLCAGCGRTLDEIVEWGNASNERKRAILDAVAARRPA